MLKKIWLIILSLFLVLLFTVNTSLFANSDWTLEEDGYYYYNKDINFDGQWHSLESHNGNFLEVFMASGSIYLPFKSDIRAMHRNPNTAQLEYLNRQPFLETLDGLDTNSKVARHYYKENWDDPIPDRIRYLAEEYTKNYSGDLSLGDYNPSFIRITEDDYNSYLSLEKYHLGDNQQLLRIYDDYNKVNIYDSDYINFKVKYDPVNISTDSFNTFFDFNDALFKVVQYKQDGITEYDTAYYITTLEDSTTNVDLSGLPLTFSNKIGIVDFEVDGFNLVVKISYNRKIYYLEKSFDLDTDMTIFDTIEAYYMNIDSTPQIIINHSDRPYLKDILESGDEKPTFVPHSIWDLNTNEIKTVNSYKTNVYIKQNDQGVIISYVYIDEYIIDRILSAQLSWVSRQKNTSYWSWLLGKYTDWEYNEEFFTSEDQLAYKNLTQHWSDIIPIWNIARAIYISNKTHEMPIINEVDLNNIQDDFNISKLEIEMYFRKINKDFTQFNNDPRYKLWAFALQGGKSYMGTQTEIYHNPEDKDDPMNFKIIEIAYETNGVIYEAVGDDIDLYITVHEEIDGLLNEKKLGLITTIVFALAGFLWIYTLIKARGFNSIKKFLEVSLLYAVALGILYLLFGKYLF